MKVSHVIQREREWLIKNAMPDICQIVPKQGTGITIGGTGEITETPASPRIWRGTINIPCLFYIARAFRPDIMPVQTTVTDEYNLDLPFDAPITEDDNVIINSRTYEVRRLIKGSEHNFIVEALVFFSTAND